MDNNDILIRLRYALDIKDNDMIKIFEHGGIKVTKEELRKLLIRSKDSYHDEADEHDEIEHTEAAEDTEDTENTEDTEDTEDNTKCNNATLESFLNGFIIFKRGKQERQPEKPVLTMKDMGNVNNVMLKKLKIALSLTSEDMLELLEKAGVTVSKGELSAIFRKEGHKHYRECGDNYARNFLKGLTIKHRG